MTDIVERLRETCTGREVWRVADPETGAYCLAFDYTNSIRPESDARRWLAHHVAKFPDSRHANKVVIKAIERADAEQLAHEAADEIERLRAEVAGLQEDAERWRHIRDKSAWTATSANGLTRIAIRLPVDMPIEADDELDVAVDAARKGTT